MAAKLVRSINCVQHWYIVIRMSATMSGKSDRHVRYDRPYTCANCFSQMAYADSFKCLIFSCDAALDDGHIAGLVFNPATSLDLAKYVLDKVDIILLMSVNPGFGGQSFIPSTMQKLKEARKMIDDSGYDIRLEVDGGVTAANIKEIAAAGADMFVAGSAIFKSPRTKDAYAETVSKMREQLATVR